VLFLGAFDQLRQRIKTYIMNSRITIEVDFENNNLPIIQIVSKDSDDVRDKLVKSFLQNLKHCSRWTTIQFVGNNLSYKPEPASESWTWKITPVTPEELESEVKLMQAEIKRLKEIKHN